MRAERRDKGAPILDTDDAAMRAGLGKMAMRRRYEDMMAYMALFRSMGGQVTFAQRIGGAGH